MTRRIYDKRLNINGKIYTQVMIDPHYENKHSSTISDSIILFLIELLNGSTFKPVNFNEGLKYFVNAHLELKGNFYKLIWLLHDDQSFVGVVNAYRR